MVPAMQSNRSAMTLPRCRRPAMLGFAAALAFATPGCANLTPAQNGTLGGAGIGAAGGAVLGAISGNAGLGALIGAGVGAGGGYLYGKGKENQQTAYRQGYTQGRASR